MRRLFRWWETRRKFVVTVVPGYLFNQIDPASDITPPGNLRAFPNGRERAVAATIGVHTRGMKAERTQDFFHIAVRNIRAHHSQDFLSRQLDFLFRFARGVNIHDARQEFAAGYLLN